MDNAVCWLDDPNLAIDELLGIGPINPDPLLEVQVGQLLQYSGRTTGVRDSQIIDASATIQVNYGSFTAIMKDVILGTAAVQGGDSGSGTIDKASKRPVGNVFAGSSSISVFCKIKYPIQAYRLLFKATPAKKYAPSEGQGTLVVSEQRFASTMTVDDALAAPNTPISLTAHLKDSETQEPIVGRTIEFSITAPGWGVSARGITDETGTAKAEITAPPTVDTYPIKAVFKGDP